MKKTYIQPQTTIYELEPRQLLAASGGTEPPLKFTEDDAPDDDNEDMW